MGGVILANQRLMGNSLATAATGPGDAAQRTRAVETAFRKEERELMRELRNCSDPAEADAVLDKLDKLREDMNNALDHIKDTSGCQDTKCVEQARARLENAANDAEKYALDKEWGGTAPDFLKRPKVSVEK